MGDAVKRMAASVPSSDSAKRWKLLRRALLSQHSDTAGNDPQSSVTDSDQSVSVLRFKSFGLFHTVTDNQNWVHYSLPGQPVSVRIKHCDRSKTSELFREFNNTGNVCVWPSEEVLAYYCLETKFRFRGRRVCELGGGMTCLAGLVLASTGLPEYVLLTDGNAKSVRNVDAILHQNGTDIKTRVSCRMLRWDDENEHLSEDSSFDVIICADCVFFDEFRAALLQTIDRLLTADGEVLMLAPPRGDTLYQFIKLASDKFTTQLSHCYHSHVTSLHKSLLLKGVENYDPNIHYPLLLHLRRKTTHTNT